MARSPDDERAGPMGQGYRGRRHGTSSRHGGDADGRDIGLPNEVFTPLTPSQIAHGLPLRAGGGCAEGWSHRSRCSCSLRSRGVVTVVTRFTPLMVLTD